MRTRRNITTAKLTNKRMNDSVYAERRQVIDLIYRVKRALRAHGIELPRIDVRITERHDKIAGVARMGDKMVWIPEHTLNTAHLYHTVLHELCHAVWATQHDKQCKLMHPTVQRISEQESERLFIGYAKKYSH